MDDLARAFAMETRFLERLSTHREPSVFGTAYFDMEFRDRFVSNFLCVEVDLSAAEASAVIGEADRLLGGAGFPHRTVLVRSDEDGARAAPAFAGHGYGSERIVYMVHRRQADRRAGVDAEEVPFSSIRPVILETYRREASLRREIVPTFTDQHRKYERVLGTRFFAGRVGDELAGVCELWMDGSDALVEHVDTLEEYRGRGVARSVVLRAVGAAYEAGAERVFIEADDDDWPKDLYRRLGFDVVGRSWQFMKWPEGPR